MAPASLTETFETTGAAGDVLVTHPWVFHTVAVNATNEPRLMRSCAIWRPGYG